MATTRGLPKHVREECDQHLSAGHLDDAVLTALKWADRRITLSAGSPCVFGVAAVERALGPTGTIRLGSERERRGTADLLRGLMTLYRNPAAHEFPALSHDETRAVVDLTDAVLARIGRGISQAASRALGFDASEVVEFAVADLDGDGKNEVLAGVGAGSDKAPRVVVLKSAAKGYLARTVVGDAEYVFTVEARDIDGDGRAEVLVYDGAGGPGCWLDIFRWSPERTEHVQRIAADLATFTWSQPDGDGSHRLEVKARAFVRDGTMVQERRSFRWNGDRLVQIDQSCGPWPDAASGE